MGQAGPSRTREREGERDAGPAGKKERADWGGVTRLGPWRLGCGFGLGKQELAMGCVLGWVELGEGLGWVGENWFGSSISKRIKYI